MITNLLPQSRSLHVTFVLLAVLFVSGCSVKKLYPVKVTNTTTKVSYLHDVKPVVDKRCVVCHSCYNSPCQAKFSSFEGIDRGASKIEVYNATRLSAEDPTRLFIDAQSTQEWRTKGFYSLTQNLSDVNTSYNDSTMMQLLHAKKLHPEIIGDYDPEHDKLTCPRNKKELESYLDKKPQGGMPYGFPALKPNEYQTLAAWLYQGANGYTASEEKRLKTPSKAAVREIAKWEHFFNAPDPKHQITARYLYEHLYLAHIYFPNAKGEFYELVRSYTPSGKPIKIIPTLRPFDDPKTKRFYYRLQKVHATIVHKTHMVVRFDESVLKRFNELFIEPKWAQKPELIGYATKISANPFIAFKQIPVRSRYQFLLDNSRYIVMTFIRGPVCRGQMALNVIHDHFWVLFKDPEHDISVLDPAFLDAQAENLSLPIEKVSDDVLKTFSDAYRERYANYYLAKQQKCDTLFPHGYTMESLYKGVKSSDAPVLTVYRHFDSASVSRGVLGEEPRTVWVIDYAQFERIYYTLVAGYDVFGNISHQTNIRRYMDFLRIEGELNFIEYMPKQSREKMLRSWYLGDSIADNFKYLGINEFASGIEYATTDPKHELLEKFVRQRLAKKMGIEFDTINYKRDLDKQTLRMPKRLQSTDDYIKAARALTLPGSGFVRFMTDRGANNILLRIKMPDGSFITKDLVINRWHDNVNSMFFEGSRLDASKDTIDILDHFVGSYPNVFVVLDFKELADFLQLMKNTTGSAEDIAKFKKYFISRSDPKFWEYYDWFQKEFDRQQGVEAGLHDLNRYARSPWSK